MRAATTLTGLAGIALFVGAAVAQEQQITGTGPFCIKGPTGPAKCEYQTYDQCQQARSQNRNDDCVSRSLVEATIIGEGAAASGTGYGTGLPGDQRD